MFDAWCYQSVNLFVLVPHHIYNVNIQLWFERSMELPVLGGVQGSSVAAVAEERQASVERAALINLNVPHHTGTQAQ
jgi:hypothetical protein